MSKHHQIQSLLHAHLAGLLPKMPVKYENVEFEIPDRNAKVNPQVTTIHFASRTPAADDVYSITIDGETFEAFGASLADTLEDLAEQAGGTYDGSSHVIKIKGPANGMPFTYGASAVTAQGVPIAGALEAIPFKTVDAHVGNCWLRVTLLEGETTTATMGPKGLNKFVGVFQVDVIIPSDRGWGFAKKLADRVCSLFKRGTSLSEGTTRLVVSAASPGPGFQLNAWYAVPVSIRYGAHAEND